MKPRTPLIDEGGYRHLGEAHAMLALLNATQGGPDSMTRHYDDHTITVRRGMSVDSIRIEMGGEQYLTVGLDGLGDPVFSASKDAKGSFTPFKPSNALLYASFLHLGLGRVCWSGAAGKIYISKNCGRSSVLAGVPETGGAIQLATLGVTADGKIAAAYVSGGTWFYTLDSFASIRSSVIPHASSSVRRMSRPIGNRRILSLIDGAPRGWLVGSDDYGATWFGVPYDASSLNVDNNGIFQIGMVKSDGTCLGLVEDRANSQFQVFRYNNGVATPLAPISAEPSAASYLYVAAANTALWLRGGSGGSASLWRTIDAGATWEDISAGMPNHDMDPLGNITVAEGGRLMWPVVADGEAAYYASTDLGSTWTRVGKLHPDPGANTFYTVAWVGTGAKPAPINPVFPWAMDARIGRPA